MKKHILLVEYATATIEVIKELFSHPLFDITVVHEGETAKEMLDSRSFDMLITAAMLPKFHGFNLSQYAALNFPNIKIVIISEVYKGMDHRHQALTQYKANDFIEKPFDNTLFKKRVLELLGIDEKTLTAGDGLQTVQIPVPDTKKIPTMKKIEEEEQKLTSEDIFGDIIAQVQKTDSYEIKLDEEKKRKAPPRKQMPQPPKPDASAAAGAGVTQQMPAMTQQMPRVPQPGKPAQPGPAPQPRKQDLATQLLDKENLLSELKKTTASRPSSSKTQGMDLDLDKLFKEDTGTAPKRQEKKAKKIEDDISRRFEETLSGLGLKTGKPSPRKAPPPTPPAQKETRPMKAPDMVPQIEETTTTTPETPPLPPEQAAKPTPPPAAKTVEAPPTPAKSAETEDVGGYDLLGLIARGGMAEIYKAKKKGVKGFEKIIALKKILSGYGKDDKYVEMFVDEAKIAAELSHPNIVQIYDLGQKDDYLFIAMEYVAGKDLRLILRKLNNENKLFPEELSIYLVMKVLEALNYAHSAKNSAGRSLDIVHRDISPPNILLSYNGDVKLTDFGVSKASIKMHHTVAGALKGKLLYMSPEQAKAEKDVDHRSDLYSVGLILFELITGQKMFLDTSEMAILQRVQSGEVIKPSKLKKDIDPLLEIIILKMLETQKGERYQRASDIIQHLQGYLNTHYDHLPAPSHLAHTVYSLFKEDIQQEGIKLDLKAVPYAIKKKPRQAPTPPPPPPPPAPTPPPPPEPQVEEEPTEKLRPPKDPPPPPSPPKAAPAVKKEVEKATQLLQTPPPPPSPPPAPEPVFSPPKELEEELPLPPLTPEPAPPPPPEPPAPEPVFEEKDTPEPLPEDEKEFQPLIEISFDEPAPREKPPRKEPQPQPAVSSSQFMKSDLGLEDDGGVKKKKMLVMVAVAVIVILAAVIVYLLTSGKSEKQPPPPVTEDKPAVAETQETPPGDTGDAAESGEGETAGEVDQEQPGETTPPPDIEVGKPRTQKKATDKPAKTEAVTPKLKKEVPETRPKAQPKPKVEKTRPKAETPEAEAPRPKDKKPETEAPKDTATTTPKTEPAQQPQADDTPKTEQQVAKPVETPKPVQPQQPPAAKTMEGQEVALTAVDSPPKAVSTPTFKLTRRETRLLKGTELVIVRYRVDHNGKVDSLKLLRKCSVKRINDLVAKTIRGWKYKPAIKDGVRVKVWMSQPFSVKK